MRLDTLIKPKMTPTEEILALWLLSEPKPANACPSCGRRLADVQSPAEEG